MIDADKKTSDVPLTWWHSLMYATRILLLFCGIPATVLIGLTLPLDSRNGLTRSDSLKFALSMICAELLIAGILHFFAERISKRNRRTHAALVTFTDGKIARVEFTIP